MAGATLDVSLALATGSLGIAYVVFRFLGRVGGSWLGGRMARLSGTHRPWIGLGLMPQAGVAVGMGLMAAREIAALGNTVLAITIGGTVVFELIGPVLTRLALSRVGAAE